MSVNPLFYVGFLFLSPWKDLIPNLMLVSLVPLCAGYLGFLFANNLVESSTDELKNVNLDEGIQLKMKKPKEVVFEV